LLGAGYRKIEEPAEPQQKNLRKRQESQSLRTGARDRCNYAGATLKLQDKVTKRLRISRGLK
jgi:hypothetical protein